MCKCERDCPFDLPEGGGGSGGNSDGNDNDSSNAAVIQVELTPSTKSTGWSYATLLASASNTGQNQSLQLAKASYA
jgi:hypothetical protein